MIKRTFSPRFTLVFLIVLTGLIILSYHNSISSPFVLDDYVNIVNNPNILRVRNFNPKTLIEAACSRRNPNFRRPVAYLSFAVNHAVTGLDPAWFRIVNIIILCLSAYTVYFFFHLLLTRPGGGSRSSGWVAVFGALFWSLNPLMTNVSTYIVQRMTSLCVLFYVLSLVFYILGRRRHWGFFIPSGLFFLTALGAKEMAAVLPLSIIVLEWLGLVGVPLPSKRTDRWLAVCLVSGVVLFLGAGVVVYGNEYAFRPFSLGQRLLTEARVIFYYVTLFFFPNPSRLSIDHDFSLSTSFFDPPTTILAILFHVGVIILVIIGRRKARFLSAMVVLYYLHHLIESSVIPLEIIFEHRLILPGVFLAAMAGQVMVRIVEKIPHRGITTAGFAGMVLVTGLVFSSATYHRNKVWESSVSLWEDAARKAPMKARTLNNLGLSYLLAGDDFKAEKRFKKALELDSGIMEAYTNLGMIYESRGELDLAKTYLQRSLSEGKGRNLGFYHYNRAVLAEMEGRLPEAIEQYRKSLDYLSGNVEIYARMSRVFNETGRHEKALAIAAQGLSFSPTNPYLLHETGRAYYRLGEVERAIDHYLLAIRSTPDFGAAHYNLGMIFYQQGEYRQALFHFQAFVEVSPFDPLASMGWRMIELARQKIESLR